MSLDTDTTSAEHRHSHRHRHRNRPPADRRFLGLDTRVFPYAAVILAVWLLWVIITPAIDSAVTTQDPTVAGDRLAVTETISVVPAADWNVDSGFREGQRGAVDSFPAVALSRSNLAFSVDADSFDGTADELMTQIDAVGEATNGNSFLAVSGSRRTVVTDAGLTGVQVSFDTPSQAGSVTTFVVDGTGIRVQAVGPPDQVANRNQEITSMIASIGTTDGGSR